MDEPRTGKKLILATKPFEQERLGRSWFDLLSTLVVYTACLAVVVATESIVVSAIAAVIAGLTHFRIFSLYHDHNHGSLLANSPLGRRIMSALGWHILSPRPVWKETHDFHHWHNGKIEWCAIGSYPVMTIEQFAKASPDKRREYLRARHPLTIIGGYISVAIRGFCIAAYRRAPKRHGGGPVALAIHVATFVAAWWWLGLMTGVLVIIVPPFVGHMLAAYLFYVQHNFPETKVYMRGEWDYVDAAVSGSSFLVMGPVMRWFTANIGYHHVHHLNATIPNYRLAEAMAAIPELQHPNRTTMRPADVMACMRLKLWDPQAGCMQPLPAQFTGAAAATPDGDA
ncbi:MAG: fatty acid desaturase [Nannocystaceae bacterium]|nr:fatty acid desaturase [Nannocystaceae bacterium]